MSATLDELTTKIGRVSDLYAKRCDIERDDDWYLLKLQEELGELSAEYLRLTGRGRREGVAPEAIQSALSDEAADVFAQLMLFVKTNNIDLEAALERKWFRYLNAKTDNK